MNEKVIKLQEKIEQLELTVASLRASLRRLAMSTLPNPEYPYWYKLIILGISEDEKSDFEFILSLLSDRLSGRKIIVQDNDEITDEMFDSDDTIITATKAKRFPNALYANEKPRLDQTLEILSHVLQHVPKNSILNLLIDMSQQGMFEGLLEHLLSQQID